MADNTFMCGGQRRKLWLYSGSFTTTVKSSLHVVGWQGGPSGVTGDETNTGDCDWFTADDIVWYSGKITSTVLNSLVTSFASYRNMSCDDDDVVVGETSWHKLLWYSGKTTSTLKSSHSMFPGTPGHSPYGMCCITNQDQLFFSLETVKQYWMSGRFTTTWRDSQDIPAAMTQARDISFDGTDTYLVGELTDKMFKQSGLFTTTVKTSQNVNADDSNPRGIESDMFDERINGTAAPDIDVSPLTLDYEDTFISTTEEKSVTITNLGTAFLTVTAVAITNSIYTVAGLSTWPAGNIKAFSLPPSGSTTAYVIFTPVTTDVENGWLRVTSDDPFDTIESVFLTGYGTNLAPLEGTQNFTLYIDQQRTQDRYISQGRSFTGYVDQARNFDLEL